MALYTLDDDDDVVVRWADFCHRWFGIATPTLPWLARYDGTTPGPKNMTSFKVKKLFFKMMFICDDKRKIFIYICEIQVSY